MNRSGNHAVKLGLLFLLASCTSWGQAAPAGQEEGGVTGSPVAAEDPRMPAPGNKAHDNSFVIGNDDKIAINVWKEPQLSLSISVRSDGKISLPLVGELQAAGRTPLELELEIASKLKSYITAPEVTVIVEQINSRRFNILGQVMRPGSYSIAVAETALDAISVAGGFRDFAKKKSIYILRPDGSNKGKRIHFDYKDVISGKSFAQNIRLEPGDTIVVP